MKWIVLALLLLAAPVQAQEPVVKWADGLSWAGVFGNPSVAFVGAMRSENRWCKAGQLGLSALVVNVAVIALKHVIHSPRPCLGCAADGMPSGHSANSFVGSFHWRFGLAVAPATPVLRVIAKRHTEPQAAVGSFIGVGGEFVGRLIHCGE